MELHKTKRQNQNGEKQSNANAIANWISTCSCMVLPSVYKRGRGSMVTVDVQQQRATKMRWHELLFES